MSKNKKENSDGKKIIKEKSKHKTAKEEVEKRIDEELDQSFPASDPPSYSQPGNNDIKHYE